MVAVAAAGGRSETVAGGAVVVVVVVRDRRLGGKTKPREIESVPNSFSVDGSAFIRPVHFLCTYRRV